MAGIIEPNSSNPTWQRAPLAAISSPTPGSILTSPTPLRPTYAQAASLEVGPAVPAEVAAVQKKNIDFIQRQAKDAQSSLLSEVDALKAENRDLKFRLVMRDSADPSEDTRSSVAYEERVADIRELQRKLEQEKQRREDVEFDLRSEIARLKAPRPPPKPGTREADELVTAQRIKFRVKQQAKEIKELRGALEALQPRRETDADILFSTRAYVHKFENIRQSPIHGERQKPTEQDEQLAKPGVHPNGRRAPGARGKIDMQQLSTITQNRKAIREKKALGGRSLAQRTFAGSAITALPGLNVTLAQRTKNGAAQNKMKRHY